MKLSYKYIYVNKLYHVNNTKYMTKYTDASVDTNICLI